MENEHKQLSYILLFTIFAILFFWWQHSKSLKYGYDSELQYRINDLENCVQEHEEKLNEIEYEAENAIHYLEEGEFDDGLSTIKRVADYSNMDSCY